MTLTNQNKRQQPQSQWCKITYCDSNSIQKTDSIIAVKNNDEVVNKKVTLTNTLE